MVGGVAMASVGEISFSALAFGAAMTSNASAASRSVLGKLFMAKEKEVCVCVCACACGPVSLCAADRSRCVQYVAERRLFPARYVAVSPCSPILFFTRDIASGLNEAPLLHSPYIAVDLTSFSYAVCFVPCVTRDPPPGR